MILSGLTLAKSFGSNRIRIRIRNTVLKYNNPQIIKDPINNTLYIPVTLVPAEASSLFSVVIILFKKKLVRWQLKQATPHGMAAYSA